MTPIVITPAADEPVSMDDARMHLRVVETDEDARILRCLRAARVWCEQHVQRSLAVQTLEFALDAFPCDAIEIPMPPLVSVVSIKYIDEDGFEQSLSSSAFALDIYSEPPWIAVGYGTSWPSTRQAVNAVKVRYQAGYTPELLPEPIRQAILLLTGHFFENRQDVVIGVTSTAIQMGATSLLQPYRLGMGV